MTTQEKCPKCGAGSFDKWTTGHQFECNTLVLSNGLTFDGLICMKAQRDQLAERVKRLEEAADTLIDAIQSVQCWNGTYVGECIEQLESAKSQP